MRVIFATTALGMGVDSPYETSVLHISPPFSIEDYMQEIGRAGRGNSSATATLYYNKSDIADNKVFVKDSMKEYCRLDTCLRKYLLEHFGFELVIQDNCCIFCDGIDLELSMSNISIVKYRKTKDNECEEKLICDIQTALSEWKSRLADIYPIFTVPDIKEGLAEIVENVDIVEDKSTLLHEFDVWDDKCRSQIFGSIMQYTVTI